MKTLQYLWEWADGNKTLFGMVLLEIADHLKPGSLSQGISRILGAGMVGGGALHKIFKGKYNTGK